MPWEVSASMERTRVGAPLETMFPVHYKRVNKASISRIKLPMQTDPVK